MKIQKIRKIDFDIKVEGSNICAPGKNPKCTI